MMKRIWKTIVMTALWLALSLALTASGTAFAAIAREEMSTLTLTKLAEFDIPEGASYIEGGTDSSFGYVTAFLGSTGSGFNPMIIFDPVTMLPVGTASAQMSHANDMCYVPKFGEIYVLPMDRAQIIALDEKTREVSRVFNVLNNYHAIGYDPMLDCFAAVYSTGTTADRELHCDILDGSCTGLLSSFVIDSNLTYQGLAVKDAMIYYSCWERGSGNSIYEPVYDGVLQKDDNVIYVYDFEGNLNRALLIPKPEGYSKFEIETVVFSENRMILQFNETLDDDNKTRKYGIYEVTGETAPASSPQTGNSAAEKAAAEKAAADEAAAKKANEERLRLLEQELQKDYFSQSSVIITAAVKQKRALKLRWEPLSFAGGPVTGYEVQVCRKKNFKGKTLITEQIGGLSCRIRKLKRKTTYYVRVRAYKTDGANTFYSAWSTRKRLRTK